MLNAGKCEALQAVNETGFVVQELILYLDTHPGCSAGLARYQQAKKAHREAMEAYAAQYGPLLAEQAVHAALWDYAQKNHLTIEGLKPPVNDVDELHEDEEE